ncbi:MAG TPA: endonuclease III [Bacteroidales bacterium]|nr:endonuclease III [Bacteroidales bacterium]
MTLNDKYNYIIQYFSKTMPNAATELIYENPFQLIVAVILSAQCTDKRVNIITKKLFEKYRTPYDLATANLNDVYNIIASCSYPNSKSKYIIEMSKMLVKEFKGQVPSSIDKLMLLPGVGRKTANVIASVVFGAQTMPVDTHVKRVSIRIGLVKNTNNPLQIEKHLLKHLPSDKINKAHHWLVLHGRYICTAIKPKCSNCGISLVCDFYKHHNHITNN